MNPEITLSEVASDMCTSALAPICRYFSKYADPKHLKGILVITCDSDPTPLLCPQKTVIWSERISCIACYLGIFTRFSNVWCIFPSSYSVSVIVSNVDHTLCVILYSYTCWCLVCICRTVLKKLLIYWFVCWPDISRDTFIVQWNIVKLNGWIWGGGMLPVK